MICKNSWKNLGILGDIKSQEQQLSETSKSASLPILEEKVEPVEQLKPVQVVAQPLWTT